LGNRINIRVCDTGSKSRFRCRRTARESDQADVKDMRKQDGTSEGIVAEISRGANFRRWQCSLDFFLDFQNLIGGHVPQYLPCATGPRNLDFADHSRTAQAEVDTRVA